MTTIYPLLSYLILLATCAPGTYNYSRPWSAPPGEQPLVMWNHAHSEAPSPHSGWTTNLMGFTRFAITACSHKVHSWGAAVRGHWPSSKVTNWCSLCPCRSHTSTTMKVRGCAHSNTLFYVSGDFHIFVPFYERVVVSQVESFMTHKCVIST